MGAAKNGPRWRVHHDGVDPELDKILRRRFGRDHIEPCERPEVLTCAQWECQKANLCRLTLQRMH